MPKPLAAVPDAITPPPFTPGVSVDTDGFPKDIEHVTKLSRAHASWLADEIVRQALAAERPNFPDRPAMDSWIKANGYQVPGQEAIDADALVTHPGFHDPAEPVPGEAGDPEPAQDLPDDVDHSGELTLFPGGEKPAKSVLNIPAVRVDLGATQYQDGDVVTVTLDVVIDKQTFFHEKQGGNAKRRVRAHAGKVDVDSIAFH